VQDCNFDCNDSGIALQAMDNSHVALVSMNLKAEAFSPFRCDRNIALGINLNSLTKVLRCANNEDILTLKAEDAPDVVNLVFENADSDRISEYDIKLMDIDQEHLGIPETEYAATITMPSAEFQKICRDLLQLSESGQWPRDFLRPAGRERGGILLSPAIGFTSVQGPCMLTLSLQCPSKPRKMASSLLVREISAVVPSAYGAIATSKSPRIMSRLSSRSP
jgi:hypothetical protein